MQEGASSQRPDSLQLPPLHVPQLSPHPSSPHSLSRQSATQAAHWPAWLHTSSSEQVPQEPSHPSSPQSMSPHCGVQTSSGAGVVVGAPGGALAIGPRQKLRIARLPGRAELERDPPTILGREWAAYRAEQPAL